MRFTAKSALVTGAGRGIGRAVALRLAQEDLDITVADIRGDAAEAVAAEVAALGRNSRAVVVDVASAEQLQNAVRGHAESFGRLDVLVNNAGIMIVKPLFEHTEADWDRIFAINFKSVFFGCQAAAPVMQAQKFGRIINTASMAAYISSPLYPAYSATKAAVVSLTESLAKTLAPHIQVNAVCPGVIDTDMWDQIDRQAGSLMGMSKPKEWMNTRIERSVVMGRPGTPEEVAAVYAFLASDDAGYITGQAYGVNGGMLR